jgi:hypothetical protein
VVSIVAEYWQKPRTANRFPCRPILVYKRRMSVWRTIISAAAFGALLIAMLAPGVASAHPGHGRELAREAAPKAVSLAAEKSIEAIPAEIRAYRPAPAADHAGPDCGDRGCCHGGSHCPACCNAIAPATWSAAGLLAAGRLSSRDTALPASLAREGPPRPPKFFA